MSVPLSSKPITHVYREDFEYLLAEVKRLREILRGAPEPWGSMADDPMKPEYDFSKGRGGVAACPTCGGTNGIHLQG